MPETKKYSVHRVYDAKTLFPQGGPENHPIAEFVAADCSFAAYKYAEYAFGPGSSAKRQNPAEPPSFPGLYVISDPHGDPQRTVYVRRA